MKVQSLSQLHKSDYYMITVAHYNYPTQRAAHQSNNQPRIERIRAKNLSTSLDDALFNLFGSSYATRTIVMSIQDDLGNIYYF